MLFRSEIKESRAGDASRRTLEESIAIANIVPDGAVTVILDERGENMSSAHIAGRLQDWQRQDAPAVVFIIGAADGLAPSLREKARALPLPSGRRPGRISSFELCFWSSFIAPLPSWPGIPITARDRSLRRKKDGKSSGCASFNRENLAPRLNPVPIIAMYFGGTVFV